MSELLYDTKHYEVRLVKEGESLVIDEMGEYTNRAGYIVVNKKTEVVEHTSMIYPQAIYQAQGFSDSLDALTSAEPAKLEVVPTPDDEDVTLQ